MSEIENVVDVTALNAVGEAYKILASYTDKASWKLISDLREVYVSMASDGKAISTNRMMIFIKALPDFILVDREVAIIRMNEAMTDLKLSSKRFDLGEVEHLLKKLVELDVLKVDADNPTDVMGHPRYRFSDGVGFKRLDVEIALYCPGCRETQIYNSVTYHTVTDIVDAEGEVWCDLCEMILVEVTE